jgi:hypothetical protein
MRGKISEFGLADPNDVEHQLTSLDNIGGFERLKIRASFCYSACNKRTPRFFVSTVYGIAVYLPRSAESHREALYWPVFQEPKLSSKDRVSIRTEPFDCRRSENRRPCHFVARSKSRDPQLGRKVGREYFRRHSLILD